MSRFFRGMKPKHINLSLGVSKKLVLSVDLPDMFVRILDGMQHASQPMQLNKASWIINILVLQQAAK